MNLTSPVIVAALSATLFTVSNSAIEAVLRSRLVNTGKNLRYRSEDDDERTGRKLHRFITVGDPSKGRFGSG